MAASPITATIPAPATGHLPTKELPSSASPRQQPASEQSRPKLSLLQRVQRRVRRRVVEPFRIHVAGAVRARANARRSYDPVFVAGAMGSGTTLLALSLYQSFECAAAIKESLHEVEESSFLHCTDPRNFASVKDYEDAITPSAEWSHEAARASLLRMYRGAANGSSRAVIDKGPNGNLVRASFLAECFPGARFVLLFRDPVAAIEGFRRKWEPFKSSPLDESIRFYRSIHERFLDSMWEFPDRVSVVRYETLVEKHHQEISRVGGELDLRPAVAAKRVDSRPNVPGCGIRNVKGGQIGIVHDANSSSYARTRGHEIDQIRRELGPLHRRLELLVAS